MLAKNWEWFERLIDRERGKDGKDDGEPKTHTEKQDSKRSR